MSDITSVEVTKAGRLVDISKATDDGPGTAKFSICTEGEVDRDGDMFKAGALELEREKATMVSFQHNQEPAGVWTMSRSGGDVYANVEFLDTEAGQDTRKYLEKMGDSAQFSFRARSDAWNYMDEGYGIVFDKATVYEASPVMMGAGNDTRLESIKSRREADKVADVDTSTETVDTLKAIQTANEQSAETVKAVGETLTAVSETLTAVGETMTAVKDAVAKPEPKADPLNFNVVKSYGVHNPHMELAKALFSDGEFNDGLKSKQNFGIQKDIPVDLIKQSINSFGTITPAPAIPQIVKPVDALDAMYIMPWGSEVYRRRVIARTVPGQLSRTGSRPRIPEASSGTGVASGDFPLQTVAAAVPVSRLSAMADASVMTAYTQMGIEDLRVQLQTLATSGPTGDTNITGIPGQVSGTYTSTVASGDAAKGILNGTKGLYQAILGVRERAGGSAANYVLASAADAGKIYTSLTNQRSPFVGTQMFPYGAPMGAAVILTPDLPANTMVVATLGQMRSHVIPMMGSFRVNVAYETLAQSDEILLTFVCYAQNVVQQEGAFQVIARTDLLESE